jgi:hypothetical protein
MVAVGREGMMDMINGNSAVSNVREKKEKENSKKKKE